MTWMTLALIMAAGARITRLITTDKITEKPRDWILDRVNPLGMLTYMLGCPWCVSIYVGAVLGPLGYWYGSSPWVVVPAVALTMSYVTGLSETLTKGDD